MHWVDVIANELLQKSKNHVVASGTSISGAIHIGNAGDVIFADAICRAIKEKGGNAKLIWISDDMDPLRSVPRQLPESFSSYIGKPVSSLPCPKNCCSSFVEHFVKIFLSSLEKLGIYPEVYFGTEMYKRGEYEECTKIAIEKAKEIRKIFKEISGAEKPVDWLPFDAVCENCGKISTTESYGYENEKVLYKCVGGVAGKQKIEGCGFHGKSDLRNGKLTWRVEWAGRWKILGVSCEPFGKEHSASGGSYDTSKVIVKEIFGYEPPYPVLYEHILVDGKKMSKSLGNVLTLEEFFEVAQKEVVRYFYFRKKATKHADFDITKDLLQLIEEYERIERLYYDKEKPSLQEDLEELKRSYELSQIVKPRKDFFQVPFSHLITVVQIVESFKELNENVKISENDFTNLKKENNIKISERKENNVSEIENSNDLDKINSIKIEKEKQNKALNDKYKENIIKIEEEISEIEFQKIIEILFRTQKHELTEENKKLLKEKIICVKNWLQKYALPEYKFAIQKELKEEVRQKLTEEQKKFLKILYEKFNKIDWSAEAIHNAIHFTAKELGIEPKIAFSSLYFVILGKERGPRLGFFLSSLGKEWVIKRLSL